MLWHQSAIFRYLMIDRAYDLTTPIVIARTCAEETVIEITMSILLLDKADANDISGFHALTIRNFDHKLSMNLN